MASASRRLSWASALPSLADLAFLYPLIFILAGAGGVSSLLRDGDTGWHVRAGEWMLHHREVLKSDIFSFTKPGERWFAWQWLSEVIFAALHERFGLAGVVMLSITILCCTSALLFHLANRRCGSSPIAIGFTFLAIAATTVHWHARPLLFSMLLTVVFLYVIWLSGEGERSGPLILLPVLTALWVNLHGGFIVGILITVGYAVGQLRHGGLHRFRRLLWTALACGVASLLNPNTYQVHLFIAKYLRQSFLDRIPEFMSPDFHSRNMWTFELMLLAGVVFTLWNIRHERYADALLIVLTAHMALVAVRNVPVYVLIAAPSAAVCVKEWLDSLKESKWVGRLVDGMAELEESGRVPIIGVVALILVASMILRPAASGKFVSRFDPRTFPAAAVDFVATSPGEPRIFTNDEWGDYLTYRLFPRTRVFVDGRSDFYGADFMSAYVRMVEGRGDWAGELNRYGVDTVMMPVDAALTSLLKLSNGWRAVYDDHRVIVFQRTIAGVGAISPNANTLYGR